MMLPGAEGALVIVTGKQLEPLVPQELDAVTHTLPEDPPKVTEMEVVPCPELITAPAGTVQV